MDGRIRTLSGHAMSAKGMTRNRAFSASIFANRTQPTHDYFLTVTDGTSDGRMPLLVGQ